MLVQYNSYFRGAACSQSGVFGGTWDTYDNDPEATAEIKADDGLSRIEAVLGELPNLSDKAVFVRSGQTCTGGIDPPNQEGLVLQFESLGVDNDNI